MTSTKQVISIEESIQLIKNSLKSGVFRPDSRPKKSLVDLLNMCQISSKKSFLIDISSCLSKESISENNHMNDLKVDIQNQLSFFKQILNNSKFADVGEIVGLVVNPFPSFKTISVIYSLDLELPIIFDCLIFDTEQLGIGDVVVIKSSLFSLPDVSISINELIDVAHEFEQEVILEVTSRDEFIASKNTEADIILINIDNNKKSLDITAKEHGQMLENLLASYETTRPLIVKCSSLEEVDKSFLKNVFGVIVSEDSFKMWFENQKK